MLKVMTIVGTRPEIIKMCRVIDAFDRHTKHVLVHTGQNYDYELNQVFFDELSLRRPDYFLNAAEPRPAATIARVIERSDEVMARESPDALLLYGDTNSSLAVIAAKRRKIPVFHMEAGNRCFDQLVPEEINRKIVDHLSDINITITEHARRYLLAEGLPPDRVFCLGSHLPEVCGVFREQIEASCICDQLGLQRGEYFLVSAHREENVDIPERLESLLIALDDLAASHGLPVVVSTHPRTRARLPPSRIEKLSPLVRLERPFGFFDYLQLQQRARCVISDSGTVTEESSILGFPAVTIRDCHERPEGMDAGVLVMCGLESQAIANAVRIAVEMHEGRPSALVDAYRATDVSRRIVQLVHSYVPYVRRTVWSGRRDV